MSVINKGKTFSNGEQLTADKLNDLVDLAAFDQSATDSASTTVNTSGQIAVKDNGVSTSKIADAGITPAKLSAGGPSWDASGILFTNAVTGKEAANSLTLRADPESPDPVDGGAQISLHSSDSSVPNQIYVKSSFTYFQNLGGATVASIGSAGPTADKDLTTKQYVDNGGGFTPTASDSNTKSVTLPNGLIMKFGRVSASASGITTVNFSDFGGNFPNNVFSVVLTVENATSGTNTVILNAQPTTSSFVIKNQLTSTENVNFIAIGR